MGLNTTNRRRLVGAIFLLGAIAMLVMGQTVLNSRLRDVTFLVYWLVCFILTGLAIVVAYLDLRSLHDRSRPEARELIQNTLGRIETERPDKTSGGRSNDGQ